MGNPLIAVLYIVNKGSVIMVFPAVRLSVVEDRSFTGAASLPGADDVAAEVIGNSRESNNAWSF